MNILIYRIFIIIFENLRYRILEIKKSLEFRILEIFRYRKLNNWLFRHPEALNRGLILYGRFY